MRLGFLGTGEIAAAMLRGLAGQDHRILISPRNADLAARLTTELPGVTVAPNEKVVAESDVVFLCLMAKVAEEILPMLPFRAGQTVISVMVDTPMEKLRRLCSPATDIILTIPLPPIAQGGCPLPVYPSSPILQSLFGDLNPVLPQRDETALLAHLGVSAICSPILDQLASAVEWLAGFSGDRASAEAYVAAMIRCYLPARAQGGELEASLRALSTEGGLNATLRATMLPAKTALTDGLNGFRPRLGLNHKKEERE